jgi:hypothetical protein
VWLLVAFVFRDELLPDCYRDRDTLQPVGLPMDQEFRVFLENTNWQFGTLADSASSSWAVLAGAGFFCKRYWCPLRGKWIRSDAGRGGEVLAYVQGYERGAWIQSRKPAARTPISSGGVMWSSGLASRG